MGWDGKVERKVEMESWRRRGVGQQQSGSRSGYNAETRYKFFFLSFFPPFFETIDNFSIDSIRLDGRGEGGEGEENWRESILELVGVRSSKREIYEHSIRSVAKVAQRRLPFPFLWLAEPEQGAMFIGRLFSR